MILLWAMHCITSQGYSSLKWSVHYGWICREIMSNLTVAVVISRFLLLSCLCWIDNNFSPLANCMQPLLTVHWMWKMAQVRAKNNAKRKMLANRLRARVDIGVAFEKWRELKAEQGLKTDSEVALCLLDVWVNLKHHYNCKTASQIVLNTI